MLKKLTRGEKIVFIIAITVFMSIGFRLFVPGFVRSLKCDVHTIATVVSVDSYEYEDIENHTQKTVYQPTISYNVNGVDYESPWGTPSDAGILLKGQKVDIRYDSENPDTFVLSRWYGLEVHNFLGIILIIFTIFMAFKYCIKFSVKT